MIDTDGSFHHRCDAAARCQYLLRPDGYVACRSQPLEARHLFEYLSSVSAQGS